MQRPNCRALTRALVAAAAVAALTWPLALPAGANEPPEQQQASAPTEVPEPNTVTAYGSAVDRGPSSPLTPAHPLIGIAARTPEGYWLVGSDGGVFTFGNARFHGSTGDLQLNQPIVGMTATPSGAGYWLVAADGGVFTFGDARFHGSTGDLDLVSPIVGIASTPSGAGYWLVAADGGVFTFGDARFHGSEGGAPLDAPVMGMAASPDGLGYRLAARDGTVYSHGVTDQGSAADHDKGREAPVVGIAAAGSDGYWLLHGAPRATEEEDTGADVARLQQRLTDLGYWLGPVDGVYGDLTEQAVYAFQKYEGLTVDGVVGPETRQALARAARPRARTEAGDVIEIDKSRQLLFFVVNGRTAWTFNTSTGTEEPYTYEGETYLADTPPGRWEVYRQVDGYRTSNLGRLYRPKYFHHDGIAIHGYPSVPPYPASHGCVRVTNAAIDFIWANGLAPIGADVWVHGTTPR